MLSGRTQVFREICRERKSVARARKGRTYSDEAPRRRQFWEATVPPSLAEEPAEPVSIAEEPAHAPAALNAEIMECQNVAEVLEIVSEEAAIMSGANASLALMRLVNLSKSQLHQLRNRPEFANLLTALEQHIHELGPKVILSIVSSFQACLSRFVFTWVHMGSHGLQKISQAHV
jgi:hypothetical protein